MTKDMDRFFSDLQENSKLFAIFSLEDGQSAYGLEFRGREGQQSCGEKCKV